MNGLVVNETIYQDLQVTARRLFAGERPGHTLQPEALVHEAWLRLVSTGDGSASEPRWNEPSHFHAAASLHMRCILIDHGRRRWTPKHGANRHVGLEAALNTPAVSQFSYLELDDALERLREKFPDAAKVVRLKFFFGMTDPEIGAALRISPRTVRRYWRAARVWLRMRIEKGA